MPQLRRVQAPPAPVCRIGAAGLFQDLHRSFQGAPQGLFGQVVELLEKLRDEIREIGLEPGREGWGVAVRATCFALEEKLERDAGYRAGPALRYEMPVPDRELSQQPSGGLGRGIQPRQPPAERVCRGAVEVALDGAEGLQ